MKIRRSPDKELEVLHRQKESLEREINKCAVFAEGVKTDFLKDIEYKFKVEMDEIEDKLDSSYSSTNTDMVHFYLGRRSEIKKILSIKDYAKKRSELSLRYGKLMQKIKGFKSA